MAARKKRQRQSKEAATGSQWDATGPAIDQKLMKALGHPLRIAILSILNDRMASPTELSRELGEGLSQVSYHVKVLKDYEMIQMVRTEPRRGAVEHFYQAVREVFLPSWQMKAMPKSAQRSAFVKVLKEIEQDLGASLAAGAFENRPDWVVARDPKPLDDKGRKDAEKLAARCLQEYKAIGVEAGERIAKGESEPVPTTAVLLIFSTIRRSKSKAQRKKGKSS